MRTNDESLELFADLLEPVGAILADGSIVEALQRGEKMTSVVAMAIKRHKPEVVEVLARIDGVDPKEYKVNILALPFRLLNLLNRPEVKDLFTTQDQSNVAASSGPATESTEDGAN